jgi:hypothetical protein
MKTNRDYGTFNQTYPKWIHPTHNKDWHALQAFWEIVSDLSGRGGGEKTRTVFLAGVLGHKLEGPHGGFTEPSSISCLLYARHSVWGTGESEITQLCVDPWPVLSGGKKDLSNCCTFMFGMEPCFIASPRTQRLCGLGSRSVWSREEVKHYQGTVHESVSLDTSNRNRFRLMQGVVVVLG